MVSGRWNDGRFSEQKPDVRFFLRGNESRREREMFSAVGCDGGRERGAAEVLMTGTISNDGRRRVCVN